VGLYYNPNPPHVGAQQPLDQRKLTPPQSGPAPQNPPFRGSFVGAETLSCWAAAVTAAVIVLPQLLVPQPAAAGTPYVAPRYDIYRSWDAPASAPIVAINLNPPISGPAVNNPPLIGARIPTAVLNAWLPPTPAPIVAVNMDPPVSGPAVNNPPILGAQIPLAIQIAWLPPVPAPIVAINLDPPVSGPAVNNPPFMGGARVGGEILIAWLPPAPAPIVGPKFTTGVSSTNPPFMGGARIPLEVQVGWLSPAPMPIVGPKFTAGGPPPQNPPFAGSRVGTEIQIGWLAPASLPIVAAKSTPPSAPQNPPVIGSVVPVSVLAWWNVAAPPLQGQQAFYIAPAAAFPFTGARVSREVLQSWDAAWRNDFVRPLVRISGPLPSAPPLGGGSVIRQSVLLAWLQPPAYILTATGALAPFGGVPGPLRFLDVHGSMPPSEFGTVLAVGTPLPSIPSIEPIPSVGPGYRKLSDKGVLES
jgi:hypothetical protein